MAMKRRLAKKAKPKARRSVKKAKKAKRRPVVRPASGTPDRSNLKIVYVPLGDLKPWEDNPRRNDAAAERLADLMAAHGFVNPIIATPDNTVRAGHTRLKSAKKRGMKTVPVIYVEFGSEFDAQMYSIADNRSAEWSEWDEERLADLLAEGREVDVKQMARLSGIREEEIEGLRTPRAEFASDTFAGMVSKFEENCPEGEGKKGEYWCWFIIPDEASLDRVKEKFSRRKGRELDWGKVGKTLGIPVGRVCPTCEGTGKDPSIEGPNRRCQPCGGSGRLPSRR